MSEYLGVAKDAIKSVKLKTSGGTYCWYKYVCFTYMCMFYIALKWTKLFILNIIG